jgi:NDP-sugar pyrophosphorylase family protein
VLTADNVTELDFDLLSNEYDRLDQPACMVIPVLPVDGLEGDFIHHQNNKVIEINRMRPAPIYCSGIQILNPEKINKSTQENEDFYSVWNALIEKKQLYCSNVYPKNWFTIDTLEQLNRFTQRPSR